MESPKVDHAEQDARLKANMACIKNKIIVMSGKGGVGKTTVAVNLAYALAAKRFTVGILDVDVHGPNIAKMLGIEERRLMGSDAGIEPVAVLPNLSAVSLALFGYHPDEPVIWRGPLKMATIKQLLSDVNWGVLDYLIVDSPPGTGDEPLTICQLIPELTGAVIVTTPQDVAIMDARKSVSFARALKIPVLGVIENMSGLRCPHCSKHIDLFGQGGGERAALDLNVPFLGRIPMEPDMVVHGDSGKPYVHFEKDNETAKIIQGIVDEIVKTKDAKTG